MYTHYTHVCCLFTAVPPTTCVITGPRPNITIFSQGWMKPQLPQKKMCHLAQKHKRTTDTQSGFPIQCSCRIEMSVQLEVWPNESARLEYLAQCNSGLREIISAHHDYNCAYWATALRELNSSIKTQWEKIAFFEPAGQSVWMQDVTTEKRIGQ